MNWRRGPRACVYAVRRSIILTRNAWAPPVCVRALRPVYVPKIRSIMSQGGTLWTDPIHARMLVATGMFEEMHGVVQATDPADGLISVL